VAAITLVKGETPALDRTWMSMPDGSTRQVAAHVVHDLPHLVVESLFGIEDGLWGVLARGGFGAANPPAPAAADGGPGWSPTSPSTTSGRGTGAGISWRRPRRMR
jgi:hypothetical protein